MTTPSNREQEIFAQAVEIDSSSGRHLHCGPIVARPPLTITFPADDGRSVPATMKYSVDDRRVVPPRDDYCWMARGGSEVRQHKNRLYRETPSSARERVICLLGKDGEAGDVCSIVDGAGCRQADKGPLEARPGFPTEPYCHCEGGPRPRQSSD